MTNKEKWAAKPSLQKKQGGKPNEKLYPACQREASGINSVFSITKKIFVLHRDKDFSRNRKLPFETVIKLILEMAGNTLDHELRYYYFFSLDMPTVSSFVQRRGLISPDAFLYLFHILIYFQADVYLSFCRTTKKRRWSFLQCFISSWCCSVSVARLTKWHWPLRPSVLLFRDAPCIFAFCVL